MICESSTWARILPNDDCKKAYQVCSLAIVRKGKILKDYWFKHIGGDEYVHIYSLQKDAKEEAEKEAQRLFGKRYLGMITVQTKEGK